MGDAGLIGIIYGCMFSGKSTRANRNVRRHLSANQRVIVIKPQCDERGRTDAITSHDGVEFPEFQALVPNFSVLTTADPAQALERINASDVFIFEEAQFWGNESQNPDVLVPVLCALRDAGKIVYVFMLDLTFEGKVWPAFVPIFQICDRKEHLLAICPGLNKEPCGRDAAFSKRLSDSSNLIQIGGRGDYQACCYKHFSAKVEPFVTQIDPMASEKDS